METINLIKGKSPREQRAIRRWFWYSCIIISLLLITLFIMQGKLFIAYRMAIQEHEKLHSVTQQLHECLIEKRSLKEQSDTLQVQLAKINRIAYRPKNPHLLLQSIMQALQPSMALQNILINKKKLDISLLASNTKEMFHYVKQLQEHKLIEKIYITTLEPTELNQLKGTLHAHLI